MNQSGAGGEDDDFLDDEVARSCDYRGRFWFWLGLGSDRGTVRA